MVLHLVLQDRYTVMVQMVVVVLEMIQSLEMYAYGCLNGRLHGAIRALDPPEGSSSELAGT